MNNNGLPPFSPEAERGALGCVLLSGSCAEADQLLLQLSPRLFYDERNKLVFSELIALRQENHVLDSVVLPNWLRGRGVLDKIGGLAYLASLTDETPSIANFRDYLEILKGYSLRRWALAKTVTLESMARAEDLSIDTLRAEFSDLLDKSNQIGGAQRPLIEVWTLEQAKQFTPDPTTFLIGGDIISRGEISVLAGWQGLGKTRLVTTLALAAARGPGHNWMGYEVRRQFRTFILQSENSPRRIQTELCKVPDPLGDWFRVSLPCMMDFSSAQFRAEMRRLFEAWPYDLLVIDNMNDVARADAREDFLEALDSIRSSLPPYPDTPAILLVAHFRKQRGGDHWRPKTGREILHEISGSLVLTAKARTVFIIQPGSTEVDDNRVVFEVAKSNNDIPLPRSAWQRANGEFLPLPDFDFENWFDADPGRKVVSADIMAALFEQHGPVLSTKELVEILQRDHGFSQATAYRAAKPGGRFPQLWETPQGRLAWNREVKA